MSRPEALKMTPTCSAVIRHYAGEKNATQGMRLDVFQKAVTRCTRAGWLEGTEVWPYTGVTDLGRRASRPGAMSRDDMASWFRARGMRDGAEMDRWLTEYAGETEDEMDAIYSAMHPVA